MDTAQPLLVAGGVGFGAMAAGSVSYGIGAAQHAAAIEPARESFQLAAALAGPAPDRVNLGRLGGLGMDDLARLDLDLDSIRRIAGSTDQAVLAHADDGLRYLRSGNAARGGGALLVGLGAIVGTVGLTTGILYS
jgi:hypothetical protein